MTDKPQDASDFSFRTFDIYRRFVEVLQYKPAYLEEFKNGSPKEETCLDIIKRVFQSQQEEEEIKKYLQYFANHSKMMAGHAEKLPDSWNEAIDYTSRYIKEIRNYLRNKGISVRSGLSSIEKIAKDIAKHIHDHPSARQIEAIRYYLKHDLRNPKKNIISSNTPRSKHKSKKSSRSLERSKTMKDKIVEEKGKIHIQKENDKLSTACASTQGAQDFVQMSNEKDLLNNDETMATLEYEHVETEIIVYDILKTPDKVNANSDPFNDEQKSKNVTPEVPIKSYNNAEKISSIHESEKVEETGGIEQTFKTAMANSSSKTIENGNNNKFPNYNFNLKRKSSSPLNYDHYCGLKKQLQNCRRIPKNNYQKQNMIRSHAVRIKNVSYSSSDSEINVTNDDESDSQKSSYLMMNKKKFENGIEDKGSLESEISKPLKDSMFNLKSQVKNMSYTTAVKYIDLVTTFCELRNAISQEELFTLRKIRDKVHSESLKEQSSM